MKNKLAKILCFALLVITLPCCVMLSGCSSSSVAVKSIEYSRTDGLVDIYTITYTDGNTQEFKVKNGADGQDAEKITISEAYQDYKTANPDSTLTYDEFLKAYLTVENNDKTKVINQCLLSSFILYSEFKVDKTVQTSFWHTTTQKTISRSGGSGVLYKIDTENDVAYIITNYHVVYSSDANADNNGNIAYRIFGYLYGSEGSSTVVTDSSGNYVLKDGYPQFEYGDSGLEFEYVGGSAEKDLAIIKTSASKLLAINSQAKEITFADDYTVGETAIAIGNVEGNGISVTEGIVSVDSEYIALAIDETRIYRTMRIDTAIYHGSSGGGLFNDKGELIGITNSGDEDDENVNYAIPLSIVKGTVENIMYYYLDGDPETTGAYKVSLGVTVNSSSTKFVYDEESGSARIVEVPYVTEITKGSIAETLGLQVNDILKSITINNTEYEFDRAYEMGDLLLTLRSGDKIALTISRTSTDTKKAETITTAGYMIENSDLVALA